MRSLVTLVITAAMCFAAGFGAVRWGQRGRLITTAPISADHATYAALLKVEPKEFADREYEFKSRLKEIASWYDGASIGEAWMDRWLEIDRVAALQFINRSNIFAEFGSDRSHRQTATPHCACSSWRCRFLTRGMR